MNETKLKFCPFKINRLKQLPLHRGSMDAVYTVESCYCEYDRCQWWIPKKEMTGRRVKEVSPDEKEIEKVIEVEIDNGNCALTFLAISLSSAKYKFI